ncbi:MAG: hypothetical protein R3F01_05410 [Lysobacteraceae bacterium]
MEEVTQTLYQVRNCGFYVADEFRFATCGEAFQGFRTWTETLESVGDSSTYSPSEDDDILRAFCLDVRELQTPGRWLLVTWNELATVDEGVQVVETASRIGNAHVSAVEVDAHNLPGYPAYFCIDTEGGVVLNLRFDQRLNGSRQFQRFMQGYLAGTSPWCVWNADDPNELLGYEAENGQGIEKGAVPEFSTTLTRVARRDDFIRQNVNNIRKVVHKASVNPVIEEHKVFLDSSFRLLGLPVNNRLKAEIPFQYEFKTRLTAEKINLIINEYRELVNPVWDDVGFVFARQSNKIHWLSGSVARSKQQVDVERVDGGMIDVESLMAYLNENFDNTVRQILNGE